MEEQIQKLEETVRTLQSEISRLSIDNENLKNRFNKINLTNDFVLTGSLATKSGISTQAGGSKAITMGVNKISLSWGSGAPTISASKGSLYLRTDGSSTSTRAYINSDGGTTWVAVTTAS